MGMGSEQRSSVLYYRYRHPVQYNNISYIQPSQLVCTVASFHQSEVSRLSQSVNTHPNWIKLTQSQGQTYNKIHRDKLLFSLENRQPLHWTFMPLMLIFELLTFQALCHKHNNISPHPTPPIILFQVMVHLCHTRVDWISSIMSFFQYQSHPISYLRHTNSTIKPQYTPQNQPLKTLSRIKHKLASSNWWANTESSTEDLVSTKAKTLWGRISNGTRCLASDRTSKSKGFSSALKNAKLPILEGFWLNASVTTFALPRRNRINMS